MVTHVIIESTSILNGGLLDNAGDFFALVGIHLEEHLLGLAILGLVVVDQEVTQDPFIELDPGLEAAAKLAAALHAATIFLRLLLVGVKSCAVLAIVTVNVFDNRILGEKVSLHAANSGSEEDSCEDNEGQAGRHDDFSVRNIITVDPENKTEGDGSANETSITDEEHFFPLDTRVVTAESEEADQANGATHASNDDDSEHHTDEGGRPVEASEREEGDSQVTEDEGCHKGSDRLEDEVRSVLALGRQTVPGVVSHDNTGGEQGNDTRHGSHLSGDVGAVGNHKDDEALNG